MTIITPAMSYFLHKGLCVFGYVNDSFELFKLRSDKILHFSQDIYRNSYNIY